MKKLLFFLLIFASWIISSEIKAQTVQNDVTLSSNNCDLTFSADALSNKQFTLKLNVTTVKSYLMTTVSPIPQGKKIRVYYRKVTGGNGPWAMTVIDKTNLLSNNSTTTPISVSTKGKYEIVITSNDGKVSPISPSYPSCRSSTTPTIYVQIQ